MDRSLRDKLLDCYMTLDAYPDARALLTALKGRGDSTAILSNGSPAMLVQAHSALARLPGIAARCRLFCRFLPLTEPIPGSATAPRTGCTTSSTTRRSP